MKDVCALTPNDFNQHAIEQFIHFAAKAGVRPSFEDPAEYVRTNVLGTLQCLEFCRVRSIARFCLGSSSSVYGNKIARSSQETDACATPISPYAVTKRSAELLCATYSAVYSLRIVVLRFFTVYGPRQRPDLAICKFVDLLQQNKPLPIFGEGTSSRDYTYVSDIIDGTLAALNWVEHAKHGSLEIFNLGSGRPISLSVLVQILEKCSGLNAKLNKLSDQIGDVYSTWADLTKSHSLLGYAPKITLEQGVRNFLFWLNPSMAA